MLTSYTWCSPSFAGLALNTAWKALRTWCAIRDLCNSVHVHNIALAVLFASNESCACKEQHAHQPKDELVINTLSTDGLEL
jgi:hypothetical protein